MLDFFPINPAFTYNFVRFICYFAVFLCCHFVLEMQVAETLLAREVLNYNDMKELLGDPPHKGRKLILSDWITGGGGPAAGAGPVQPADGPTSSSNT